MLLETELAANRSRASHVFVMKRSGITPSLLVLNWQRCLAQICVTRNVFVCRCIFFGFQSRIGYLHQLIFHIEGWDTYWSPCDVSNLGIHEQSSSIIPRRLPKRRSSWWTLLGLISEFLQNVQKQWLWLSIWTKEFLGFVLSMQDRRRI